MVNGLFIPEIEHHRYTANSHGCPCCKKRGVDHLMDLDERNVNIQLLECSVDRSWAHPGLRPTLTLYPEYAEFCDKQWIRIICLRCLTRIDRVQDHACGKAAQVLQSLQKGDYPLATMQASAFVETMGFPHWTNWSPKNRHLKEFKIYENPLYDIMTMWVPAPVKSFLLDKALSSWPEWSALLVFQEIPDLIHRWHSPEILTFRKTLRQYAMEEGAIGSRLFEVLAHKWDLHGIPPGYLEEIQAESILTQV